MSVYKRELPIYNMTDDVAIYRDLYSVYLIVCFDPLYTSLYIHTAESILCAVQIHFDTLHIMYWYLHNPITTTSSQKTVTCIIKVWGQIIYSYINFYWIVLVGRIVIFRDLH